MSPVPAPEPVTPGGGTPAEVERDVLYIYTGGAPQVVPSNDADNGHTVLNMLSQLDFNPRGETILDDGTPGFVPPAGAYLIWHSDTHEVEFLEDGIAQAQCEVGFAASGEGGVRSIVVGPTVDDAEGTPQPFALQMGPTVSLAVDLAPSGGVGTSGGGIYTGGATLSVPVEAGDRWSLATQVGATDGTVSLIYCDFAVYWTNAGYSEE